MKRLFTKSGLQRHKNEKSVVRNVSGATLEKYAPGASEDCWINDPIGSGLKSTQQIPIDWSDYAQHVFFNSAEAKANMAFDEIINGYPFDGTSAEKVKFLSQIGGFTKHILDQVNKNLGYLALTGTQYIETADVTGALSPELARSINESVLSKNLHLKGTTVEFWYKKADPSSLQASPTLIYQKKKNPTSSEFTTKKGITVWNSQVGTNSSVVLTFTNATSALNATLTISSPTISTIFNNSVVITLAGASANINTSGAGQIDNTLSKANQCIKLAELLNQIPGYTATLDGTGLIVTLTANYAGSNYNFSTPTASGWTAAPVIGTPTPSNATAGKQQLHFLISSDDFKSISISTDASGDASIPYGEWRHVAITYERGTTERVNVYINGILRKTTSNSQAELDDIQLADGMLRIGGASAPRNTIHSSYAADPGPLQNFTGNLDEFRIWLGVRTAEDIKEKYQKNVDATPELLLNYRFNEPPTSSSADYNAKSVILDYSGNSYHSVINGYGNAVRQGSISLWPTTQVAWENHMVYEKLGDNPILFPDWEPTRELNKNLVISGNHYDRNNPNLITKLIPDHYFEEAHYFEGIETDFETPERLSVEGVAQPLPGNSKLPPRVVMLSFLLVWANHFDDVKLYIDSFSLLNKVTYDTYNQIPAHIITFLADYYGIELPNPYSTETIAKYRFGEALEADSSYGTPLSKTLDRMWRRVLVNLPHLLRSRGTVQGIKALINTLGIEADSVFRFREFGGAVTKQISTARIKKKKRSQFLDFKKLDYIKSEQPLWAYRHEPGAPDPASAPVASEILFQSGDITIVKPATAPQPTTFMSGSWAWEGRYTLSPTELTSSLFRIERTNTNQDILVNLVAMRADETDPNYAGPDFTVKLFVDGYSSTSGPIILELDGINLWDNKPWYISVSNKFEASGTANSQAQLHLSCIKHSNSYIEEHHSGSITYAHASAAKSGTMLHNGIPLFEIDENNPASTLNYYVGKNSSASYNTAWNHASIPPDPNLTAHTTPTQSEDLVIKQAIANTTSYSGKLSHMRMWTKHLEKREQIEHALNPFSIHVKNPVNSSAFPSANKTFLNSSNVYETIPLGKISTKFEGSLPEGSWERLRQHFDMYQTEITMPNSANMLLSSSIPFSDNISMYGTAANKVLQKEEFIYTLAPPDFDSNASENKVRIRSFADKETADLAGVEHGTLNELPFEVGVDDRRFSIESSLVNALNEDIVNMMGDSSIMNNYLGAPELEYAVEYPEIKKVMDIYFQRLTGKVNYNAILEFQRWFNNNFASLVEQFLPHTADFLGINFVIESHMLERHKMEYKQGDVHVDIRDRQAFSQEPLFLGTIRSEIS